MSGFDDDAADQAASDELDSMDPERLDALLADSSRSELIAARVEELRVDNARERVAAGAAWLDAAAEAHPLLLAEWWKEIDLEVFELESGCRCVLGQLTPHVGRTRHHSWRPGNEQFQAWMTYHLGAGAVIPAELRLSEPEAIDLGFLSDGEVGEDYGALEAEWRSVIGERQGGRS